MSLCHLPGLLPGTAPITHAHWTPGYDKLYKIRSVLDNICEKSRRFFNPGRKFSVDEAMVKFKGRSSINSTNHRNPSDGDSKFGV